MLGLERLQHKPLYYQIIIFGSIALVIYAAFWYFYTSHIRVETGTINEQVAKLQQDNERARIASQRINEFRAAFERAQADYEDLKALLPEQRELTSVLLGIQDRARGRLSVRRFTPKDDVQQDFASGKPIEIEVTGSYGNLGAFFGQMAAYQRIVSISDFRVRQSSAQSSNNTIDAQFLMTAYYVTPEKLQQNTAATGAKTAAASQTTPDPVKQ